MYRLLQDSNISNSSNKKASSISWTYHYRSLLYFILFFSKRLSCWICFMQLQWFLDSYIFWTECEFLIFLISFPVSRFIAWVNMCIHINRVFLQAEQLCWFIKRFQGDFGPWWLSIMGEKKLYKYIDCFGYTSLLLLNEKLSAWYKICLDTKSNEVGFFHLEKVHLGFSMSVLVVHLYTTGRAPSVFVLVLFATLP